jgi:hypothetical protein
MASESDPRDRPPRGSEPPPGSPPKDAEPRSRRRSSITISVPRVTRITLTVPQVEPRHVRIGLYVSITAGLAFMAGLWWLRRIAPGRVDEAVRGWAAARVLALSDSVYRLDIGGIGYNPATGSVSLDSFRLSTDSARNAARARPLPIVTLSVRGGHVDGVRLRNVFGSGRRTVSIGTIRVDDIDADVVLPPALDTAGAQEPAPPPGARTMPDVDFFEWQRGVSLPEGVPRIRIGQVQVPQVKVVVRPAAGAPGQVRVLPQLAMELDSLVMDARDTATTPIYASDIRLRAERYRGGWDSLTSLSIERAEGSFADSVLRVEGVEIRPTRSDAELRQAGGPRHTRVIATLGGFDARGIAWGEILRHATLAVRAIAIDAPRLDLLVDHNLREGRETDRPRMPNQVMRDFPLRLLIDTVRVRDGVIAYAELEPGQPLSGVVTFEQIEASLLNLSNDPGRMSVERPAVFTASARLMGTGALSTELEIPLLSQRFDMKYRGSLGPMPLTDFNRFAATNSDVHFTHGDVLGVDFEATVAGGLAKGRVVPRYRDLAIGLQGKDEGIMAKVKRKIASIIANKIVLRQDNPEHDGKGPLITAVIDRRRAPSEGLFSFLWYTVRDPIKKVVKP